MITRIWKCSIVVILGVLIGTAPAHAAYIFVDEDINLSFGNGYQAVGQINFLGCCGPDIQQPNEFGVIGPPPSLYLDGVPLTWDSATQGLGDPFTVLNYELPLPGNDFLDLTLADAYPGLPSVYSFFTLDGTVAVSGDVQCISGCPVSATPLPDTLLLFGAGLLILATFAWWGRKVSSVAR